MRSQIITDHLKKLQEKIKSEISQIDRDLQRSGVSEIIKIRQEAQDTIRNNDKNKVRIISSLAEKERKAKVFNLTFNASKAIDRKVDLEFALGELNTFFYRNSEEYKDFLRG